MSIKMEHPFKWIENGWRIDKVQELCSKGYSQRERYHKHCKLDRLQ